MVTYNMLRTCVGKQIFAENLRIFRTFTPISELPSIISTMGAVYYCGLYNSTINVHRFEKKVLKIKQIQFLS